MLQKLPPKNTNRGHSLPKKGANPTKKKTAQFFFQEKLSKRAVFSCLSWANSPT
jgi:hypothetical protein